MVPASDDSQTNSCLKNPILMRIRAGATIWALTSRERKPENLTVHHPRMLA